MLQRRRTARLMVFPAVIMVLLVGVGPLILSLFYALYKQAPNPAMPSQFYGLGNLFDLLKDDQFYDALRVTAIVMVTVVPLQLLLGFFLAQALNQISTRVRAPVAAFLLIPSALAPIIVGVMWWMLFNPVYGAINAILTRFLGMQENIRWPIEMPWAIIAIIVATVWQWTPFVSLILLGGLTSIPDEYREAATVDGANPLQNLWHITLPLLRPYFFIAGLLMIIEVTRLYEIPFMITQGGPGNETVVGSIYLFKLAFSYFDQGRAAMMSALVIIFLSIVAAAYMRVIGGEEVTEVEFR